MNITRSAIVAGLILVLGAVDISIAAKERVILGGEVVFLDLGQRDPRAFMQGDYMALRFPLAARISSAWATTKEKPLEGERRVARIVLDDRRVATLATPDAAATLPLRYRVRNGQAWIGTNAFFFEEGSDQAYAAARFGEFRVDRESGEAVLVGLRDAKLKPLP